MSIFSLARFVLPNATVAVSEAGTDQTTTAALGQAVENLDTHAVGNNIINTATSAMTLDMTLAAVTAFILPNGAGAAPLVDGTVAFDSTYEGLVFGSDGATIKVPTLAAAQTWALGQTITAGGLQVTAGNIGVGGAPIATAGVSTGSLAFNVSGTNGHGLIGAPTVTVTVSTALVTGVIGQLAGLTINGGQALTRLASMYAGGSAPTINGTLTNNNALYCLTPTGGGTVKTIDTDSGAGTPANLTTSGTWTNASSWKKDKTDLGEVSTTQVGDWLKSLAEMPQPHFYRYPTVWCEDRNKEEHDAACSTCHGGHQDWEYDDLFHFLDDTPEEIRKVICSEDGGSISTKSTDGFLMACVQELARRVLAS